MRLKKDSSRLLITLLVVINFTAPELFSESAAPDFNDLYKFPFSLGLEYQSYAYFGENKNDNDMLGFSLNARLPLIFFPQLQILGEGGFIQTDNLDPVSPQKWDHTQYCALLGLVYASRFLKNFEYSLELAGGAGYVTYTHLMSDQPVVNSFNLLGQAGFALCLAPSYNFLITFHPHLKYIYSLTPLKNYDGLVLGVGLSCEYRFGEDPDLPQAPLNSLDLGEIILPPVYASMQHYYTSHPLGKVTITNPQNYSVKDIEIYFSQKVYLDTRNYCGHIDELKPGRICTVDLYATFNDQIFQIEGSEPVNGEINVSYRALNRMGTQSKPVSFELNDKTTVLWDDYRKAAALITPADSALKNYCSFIRRTLEKEQSEDFNNNLQLAMEIYLALTELNLIYQPDPVLPFSLIKPGEPVNNDTVSLARDTLVLGSGDCDDLTILFCSLLECIGIETGFITTPGHIFPVFNTGEKARAFANLHPDRSMTFVYNNELWIPIEITLLGKADFLEAWQSGSEEYHAQAEKRGFYLTRKAWELYRPVGLKEKDLGLQYGEREQLRINFKKNLHSAIDTVLAGYRQMVSEKADKRIFNTMGRLYGASGQSREAELAFKKALALDNNYLYAKVNLGILFLRQKAYDEALTWFGECRELLAITKEPYPLVVQTAVYNASSQCYQALGEKRKAREFFELAHKLDTQPAMTTNPAKPDENTSIEPAESPESPGQLKSAGRLIVRFMADEF